MDGAPETHRDAERSPAARKRSLELRAHCEADAVRREWRREERGEVADADRSGGRRPARAGARRRTPPHGPTVAKLPTTPAKREGAQTDRELFFRLRDDGDRAARDELVARYLPLARSLARRYAATSEPLDDLVQVASLGLVKAVDRFDPTRDLAFRTYALPTVLGELKRHFRDKTWSVRVPHKLQEASRRVDKAVSVLAREGDRAPTISEIAAYLVTTEESVLAALEAGEAYRASSFDAPRAGGDEDAGQTLGDAHGQDDDGFGLAEHRATLERLMLSISEREREVLGLRFAEDLTQTEIAKRVGVSQMQVSRLIRQALERLREAATEADPG